MTANRFGVIPLPGQEWKRGLNVPSTAFVNQADFYIYKHSSSSDPKELENVEKCKKIIEEFKSGRLQLTNFLELEDFLKKEN